MIEIHRWSGALARALGSSIFLWVLCTATGCGSESDEPVDEAVRSLQAPYDEATQVGPRSARSDDAISEAVCPTGYTMTGCDCYSPWRACDGAYGESGVCRAFNKASGSGVYAVAQCVNFLDNPVPTFRRESLKSETSGSSSTSVACPIPFTTLTGCSCYSPWASCDGARIVAPGTCRADNKEGGHGVYAEAICTLLADTNQTGQSPVLGAVSGTADDAESRATCPDDHILTGCTCFSANASCDGAKADGRDCVAYNKAGGSGVQAQAICFRVEGCHGACGGQSPEGCACDAGCAARHDCCDNYQPICEPFSGVTTVGGATSTGG